MADNISPELLQQLYQQYLSGNYGGTGGYSPSYVQSSGEDGATPKQFLGFDNQTNYFAPSGQNMGKVTYGDPYELLKAAAFLGSFAVGGSALGAAAGGAGGMFGAGALADGAGGMSLAEGAYPASITAGDASGMAGAGGFAGDATAAGYDPAFGAYSGAPDTSVMGGSSGGYGGSDIFGGNGMASGYTDGGAVGGGFDGYAGSGAMTGAGGMAGPAGGAGGSGGFSLSSLLGGGSGSGALGGYGSLIGPATSLIGGLVGANAAKKAANAQVQASNNASGLQRDVYNTQLGLQAPYREAGVGAMSKLSSLLGTGGDPSAPGYGSLTHNFGMSDFQMDPGIQFQTQQGNLALQNSQAAKDGVLSGAAMKSLIGYNQGMAGTGYQNAYERYMNNNAATYSRLMGMTGIGQAAASNSAASAGTFGQNAGNTMIGIGNAQAGGDVGTANAISGGLNNIGGMYYLQNLLQQKGSQSNPQSIG